MLTKVEHEQKERDRIHTCRIPLQYRRKMHLGPFECNVSPRVSTTNIRLKTWTQGQSTRRYSDIVKLELLPKTSNG